ncbi:MAG: hypothetical protein K9L60_14100 [Methylovulum sp.]|jgi:hypothetical protein|nr:hypothetical protein [Methylovulum sp.]MCF8000076.1 hypothetical protein [Methylovulum sp.]
MYRLLPDLQSGTVFRAWTGHYELEISVGNASQPGIVIEHILHRFLAKFSSAIALLSKLIYAHSLVTIFQ